MFVSNLEQLLEITSGVETQFKIGKDLERRLTGRFYTHVRIGKAMAIDIAERLDKSQCLKVIDPFCGDGRLLCWLVEAMYERGKIPSRTLQISAWDCDPLAVESAQRALLRKLDALGISAARLDVKVIDSFECALKNLQSFDVCITNPPWETIKPDGREMARLDKESQEKYVLLLKEQAYRLEKSYPYSKPTRKFSGWGTNLARCGIEASVRLLVPDGYFAIVAPATILGDQVSAPLRSWLFSNNTVGVIHHYPAGSKLFESVDQSAVYLVGQRERGERSDNGVLEVVQHFEKEQNFQPPIMRLSLASLEENHYAIGFGSSPAISRLMPYVAALPKLGDYESGSDALFKIGRELDETGVARKLSEKGTYRFAKGRQISRYSQLSSEAVFLKEDIPTPKSADLHRLVWRDVARQSSFRRVIATIIPPGIVTGNSLNVLIPKKMSDRLLFALLGVFNSTIFEAQVRATISTNHLSVGAMRRVRVPNLLCGESVELVSRLVEEQLQSPCESRSAQIDVEVARWYGLPNDIYSDLLVVLEKRSSGSI